MLPWASYSACWVPLNVSPYPSPKKNICYLLFVATALKSWVVLHVPAEVFYVA